MSKAIATHVSIPAPTRDLLSEVLRQGAQQLLTQAIEAEVSRPSPGGAEWSSAGADDPHRPG